MAGETTAPIVGRIVIDTAGVKGLGGGGGGQTGGGKKSTKVEKSLLELVRLSRMSLSGNAGGLFTAGLRSALSGGGAIALAVGALGVAITKRMSEFGTDPTEGLSGGEGPTTSKAETENVLKELKIDEVEAEKQIVSDTKGQATLTADTRDIQETIYDNLTEHGKQSLLSAQLQAELNKQLAKSISSAAQGRDIETFQGDVNFTNMPLSPFQKSNAARGQANYDNQGRGGLRPPGLLLPESIELGLRVTESYYADQQNQNIDPTT